MKPTDLTIKQVRAAIESGSYYIDVQYNGERVTEAQIELAESTADDGLKNVSDKEISDELQAMSFEDFETLEDALSSVLTHIADRYDDPSGHQTITPVVELKRNYSVYSL